MITVPPSVWVPAGGIELEPAALEAVVSTRHTSVVAGPGSGKTELLAQRALYLLQTGKCRYPQRILAISFKRDAARNLAARVEERCGSELSARLDSKTYDAFAKHLLDNLGRALPAEYRPHPDYRIVNLDSRDIGAVLHDLDVPRSVSESGYAALGPEQIYRRLYAGRLPFPDGEGQLSAIEWGVRELWRHYLSASALTFPMITRLAEFLLCNARILRALRATYGFVFLDEFQDTTEAQFSLMRTAFEGSNSILTAVGDNRQRIMGWAGAMPAAFDAFERTFGAVRFPLVRNWRSNARLVDIQRVLAREIDPSPADYEAKPRGEGECSVLTFPDYQSEGATIARLIARWVLEDGMNPRDICVLCRQRVRDYARILIDELGAYGVRARVENEFQDLLSEPAAESVLSFLSVGARERAPEDWQVALGIMMALSGYGRGTPTAKLRGAEYELRSLCRDRVRGLLEQLAPARASIEDIMGILNLIVGFLNPVALRSLFPHYSQEGRLESVVVQLAEALHDCAAAEDDWPGALDRLAGKDTVPIMTIHKSKGLEYDTVVFLGLEDGAFWNFLNQRNEDTCTFFVAFSRAKRRVILTFSALRNSGYQGREQRESRNNIRPLYDLLDRAGVEVTDGRQFLDSRPSRPGC